MAQTTVCWTAVAEALCSTGNPEPQVKFVKSRYPSKYDGDKDREGDHDKDEGQKTGRRGGGGGREKGQLPSVSCKELKGYRLFGTLLSGE